MPNNTSLNRRAVLGEIHMELILINERKLKVMLSNDDMIRYDLCGFEERISGNDINACFGEMLRDVRGRIGFCADGERLCMQYYPCRGGGCELYITKIDTDSAQQPPESATKKNAKLKTAADNSARSGLSVTFENINDMITACRTIADDAAEIPASSAFVCKDESHASLLIFHKMPHERILTLLTEFGTLTSTDTQWNDIRQDGRYTPIAAGNAIDVLSKF